MRRCALTLAIHDNNRTYTYKVRPLTPHELPSRVSKGYKLTKDPAPKDDSDPIYIVFTTDTGHLSCSCLGCAYHSHCKHCEALLALNLLDPEPLKQPTKPNPYNTPPWLKEGDTVTHNGRRSITKVRVTKTNGPMARIKPAGSKHSRWVPTSTLAPF